MVRAPVVGTSVYGALFEIECADLAALDRFEGCGTGYDRVENYLVERVPGRTYLRVVTYIAAPAYIDKSLRPYDWYKGLVVAGACQQALPGAYMDALRGVSCMTDPKPQREERLEAIEIMKRAGVEDYTQA
jgi:hypothetical protein